jgi:hypothetical protein
MLVAAAVFARPHEHAVHTQGHRPANILANIVPNHDAVLRDHVPAHTQSDIHDENQYGMQLTHMSATACWKNCGDGLLQS